jgi:hypothetical protein
MPARAQTIANIAQVVAPDARILGRNADAPCTDSTLLRTDGYWQEP